MADCNKLDTCRFFNGKMKDMHGMTTFYKKKYCWGEFTACARHMVAHAPGDLKNPLDLYPGEGDRAKRIIENGGGDGR